MKKEEELNEEEGGGDASEVVEERARGMGDKHETANQMVKR